VEEALLRRLIQWNLLHLIDVHLFALKNIKSIMMLTRSN
jgi:hypothetical protein